MNYTLSLQVSLYHRTITQFIHQSPPERQTIDPPTWVKFVKPNRGGPRRGIAVI